MRGGFAGMSEGFRGVLEVVWGRWRIEDTFGRDGWVSMEVCEREGKGEGVFRMGVVCPSRRRMWRSEIEPVGAWLARMIWPLPEPMIVQLL